MALVWTYDGNYFSNEGKIVLDYGTLKCSMHKQ